jgi:superfamily II DNA or RNA helicase
MQEPTNLSRNGRTDSAPPAMRSDGQGPYSRDANPGDAREARETLVQIAERRTQPIPVELVVDHVLGLPGPWDWPVRREALEAILRRLASARGQEIAVVDTPRSAAWGRYLLARAGEALRYDVRLWSLSPLRAACDCADFTRAALGICKHTAAVLASLSRRPRQFERLVATPPAPLPWLRWDATAAGPGPTDLLAGLRLSTRAVGDRRNVAKLFLPAAGSAWLRLRETHVDDPAARLGLVEALRHSLPPRTAADPAARAVLTEEKARLTRILKLRAPARVPKQPAASRRRLYPYQKEGVRRFLASGRLVLADDMGLGKTTQAVVAATTLHDAGLVRRGLLVVPAALKPQWEREWKAISPAALRIVEGGADERRAIYSSARRGFLVTNYEQVIKDLDAIRAWSPELVVLDEAQRIKNWATKTASSVKRLAPAYRLVLTGTPMENRLAELASIVEWVDDRALEPKWRLGPWFSAYGDGRREVVGARNLGELRARLAPVLLRRTRAEVLGQLPGRQDTTIPVALTERQRDAHDELNQPIAKLARIAQRRPLTPPEFLRLMSLLATQRMIANGLALHEFAATWPDLRGRPPGTAVLEALDAPKLGELRELVANLALTQGRKVVVFSQWRRMLELGAWAVSDLLQGAGKRALFFTGQEGQRRRTQNLVDFHDDPDAAVLFLTDAGGVGLNLQRAASACVNLELPWNPAVLEQRIGRIHRLGQSQPIDVYNLMSRGSIEERIAGLVADKRALFKGLFEGATDELRFGGGRAIAVVLERLTEGVSEEARAAAEEGAEEPLDVDAGAEATADSAAALPSSPNGGPPPLAPARDAEPPATPGPGVGDGVARLFDAVRVNRRGDGGVVIEAPPEAARALVSLFEGMSRLIAVAAPPQG